VVFDGTVGGHQTLDLLIEHMREVLHTPSSDQA
jgi:hypothetical protein